MGEPTGRKSTGKSKPRKAVRLRSLRRRAQLGDSEETSKARLILTYAHDSAQALLDAFTTIREVRGAGPGTSTNEEQDLLRAMLVLAAAGMDSMAKQLIRDSLPTLVGRDSGVSKSLEDFVTRQLRGGPDGAAADNRLLARVLFAESQRDQLIEEYIQYLTGPSLQSTEELTRSAKALGIAPSDVGIIRRDLQPIFDVRNKVIHELDINFDHPNRNRQSRSRALMMGHTNKLLEVSEALLNAVEEALENDA